MLEMEIPSSDGVEIVSDSHLNSRPRANSTRPSTSTSTDSYRTTLSTADQLIARHLSAAPPAKPVKLANVIELSDGSDEELTPLPKRNNLSNLDDDDVVVLAGPPKPLEHTISAPSFNTASSDDLPPESALWAQRGVDISSNLGRSRSVGTSATGTSYRPPARANTLATIPDVRRHHDFDHHPVASTSNGNFSSSPLVPPHQSDHTSRTATSTRGKDKMPLFAPDFDECDNVEPFSLRQRGSTSTTSVDPWKSILDDDDDAGKSKKGKGKGKGKGKEKELDGRRKRLLTDEGNSETEVDTQTTEIAAGSYVKSPVKKAPRLSAEDRSSKKEQAAAERASKAELKRQETLDKAKIREANTLKTKDKKLTAAMLTVHVSGTAFSSSSNSLEVDEDTSDEDMGGSGRKKKTKRKKKEKPSPWLEITSQLAQRLAEYGCAVESPEVPRRDVGCEGALRWTRVCDCKWDDDRNLYVPLADGQKLVVEEDTRLVFLTANDLSLHIARNSLSTFVTTLQSRLPPHINLFILLYGLNTIFKDLERVRGAEYRQQIRAAAGEGDTVPKVKPAGIGEGQPDRERLELEIMRMQYRSRCMLVSVDKVEDAVDWLEQITCDVGQKPYQRHKQSHATLLGVSEDKPQSGKDLQDTYIKILCSLKGVTEGIAKGIAGEYPTLRMLYEAWEDAGRTGGEKGKKEMLIGIGKGRNVDGVATHRAIGATLSANVYRMMTSRDPSMFI